MQPANVPLSVLLHIEEIKLRGRVMTMAADLETLLLRVILYCVIESPVDIVLEYKRMTLEVKICKAKEYLFRFHPEKLKEYLLPIKKLNKIALFRNKFAHCKIEWNEKDTSYFNLLIISDKNDRESLSLIKMTYIEFEERLENMRQTMLSLGEMAESIETAFNEKYPNFFKVSQA